jgi:hypothetical protein
MLQKKDRIQFSLRIVSSTDTISGINAAQVAMAPGIEKAKLLDEANQSIFNTANDLVNGYQRELNLIDGVLRTEITEQDMVDSANRKIRNFFYPNDINTSVPSLSSNNNVWIRTIPFAKTYAIGKNYQESNSTILDYEDDILNKIQSLLSSAGSFSELDLTTGGSPTPNPLIHALKDDLVIEVNRLISVLNAQILVIVSGDSDVVRQSENNIAISNINNLLSLLNTWMSYPDFGALPPTKLSLAQRTALASIINDRVSFLITRKSQISNNLGFVNQDLNTGLIISKSGLYGVRFDRINLRLNLFTGSLVEYMNAINAKDVQNTIKSAVDDQKNTYMSMVPTSALKSPSNNTDKISVMDPSLFSVGDNVFICAENQEELARAIKSINGDILTLNDSVPARYRPSEMARVYKDIT